MGNIPESTEVDEPLQLEPEPNAQVLEEPSDPEPPPESPKQVPARPVSNAPEEPVLIQFNRHWNWSIARALIDTVEYDLQQGELATCLNRMDVVGQHMSPHEVEKRSRMYAGGGGYMTGTIMSQTRILGDLVQTQCYMCGTVHAMMPRREVDALYRGGDMYSTCTLQGSPVACMRRLIICSKCVGDRTNDHESEWMVFSQSQSTYIPTT